jgi:hypothetical protein
MSVVSQLAASTLPPHVASSSSLGRSMTSSPTGSLPPGPSAIAATVPGRGKFQDLDAFLNSESEEEESESDNERYIPVNPTLGLTDTVYSEMEVQPRAVMAPPRSAIVPEYDDSEDEEEEGDSDSDEENVGRRLLR